MSSIPQKDRVSLCRYTFSDHRKCLTPRSPAHPHFCYFHARREAESVAAAKLADDLSFFFSGRYTSANDLCAVLGRLIPAVARGDIKPRMASTLAYLAQTLIQAIQLAQKEYIYAFGTPEWGAEIRNNVTSNVDHSSEPDTPAAAQPAANPNSDETTPRDSNPDHASPRHANSCSGGSSDPCSCSQSPELGENSDDGDTEQIESDDSAPTPEPTFADEPLTPVEATLIKN